ncbi:MAG: hypothetical protein KAV18_04270 [Candidatus Omnitrophica bacterium]|nr:hypothetical protein [Candidatus Omnitrophota bacterium]MCK4423267.1 hypothetical protein [Candidatus Omnitrophota bacterium]
MTETRDPKDTHKSESKRIKHNFNKKISIDPSYQLNNFYDKKMLPWYTIDK